MTGARRLILTVALVVVVATGAVLANLALLSSTQDSSDPVGRLSPRAVFSPARTSPEVHDGGGSSSSGHNERDDARDD